MCFGVLSNLHQRLSSESLKESYSSPIKLNISGIFSDAVGSSYYILEDMEELSQICVLYHALFFLSSPFKKKMYIWF